MYESFFQLSGKPFQLNPDPRFFFRSTGHKRAIAYMRYGLQQEQGFIVVTGDIGTGKTMIVNNLFGEIEEQNLVAAKIVSTNLRDVDLLRLIAAEFGLTFERKTKASLLHDLEEFFKSARDAGKRVLLVIDEAQNLSRSALEELRMLSNFDYHGAPLVQSFLLGQREFRSVLRAPGLEQLRQRVIAAYHLRPLAEAEIQNYIEHRLRTVGWEENPAVDNVVYKRVFAATGGVPRRINTLFDRIMLNCYLDEAHRITFEMADAVCTEVEAEQREEVDESVETFEPEGGSFEAKPQTKTAENELGRVGHDELALLKEKVENIQSSLDALNKRLTEQSVLGLPRVPVYEPPPSRFPFWTAAFASVAFILAAGTVGIGIWFLKQ